MEELLKKLLAPKPTSDMSGFRFADLFNNERWQTGTRPSYGSKRDETIEFREYVPRPKKDVTEKVTIGDDGKRTETITSKYVDVGETYGFPINDRQFRPDDGMGANSYYSPPSLPYERLADTRDAGLTPSRFMPSTFAEEGPGTASYAPPTMRTRYAEEGPGLGSYAPWSDRAGARPPMERGPVTTTGNPFGYPMRTAIQGPPRYTDVYQEMPGAQTYGPPGQLRHNMGTVGAVNSPFDRRTSEQTFAYNMVPLVRPEITPIITQRVPQGNRIPLSYNQQSQLDRFPYSGMAPMSDADKVRMLELLLSERDD